MKTLREFTVFAGRLMVAASVALSIAAGAQQGSSSGTAVPSPSISPSTSPSITPKEHVRSVEQTFLTYPEWFLVFSPAEYAQYVSHAQPGNFPFMGHVGQFWQSYKAVFDATRTRGYAFNPGYHVMVMVIGVSTTVEYVIRSGYEGLIGRLSEASCGGCRTPEDEYAAKGAQAYVDFIRVLPWYQFDFGSLLKGLWRDVPATGPHMIRKWERRLALTTEYAIKGAYGKLIKVATKAAYDAPLLETAVVVTPSPKPEAALSDMKVLQAQPDGSSLITIPRYDAFTAYAQTLSRQGLEFREIAGNDSIMLVSLVGATSWTPRNGIEEILFEQPILTQAGKKRVVATVQVKQLGASLREWAAAGVQVEHLFDY